MNPVDGVEVLRAAECCELTVNASGLVELERKPYNFFCYEAMEVRRGRTTSLFVNYHDREDQRQAKKIIRRCKSQYTLPEDRIEKRIKELV
tara:strand:+ start:212 stop:484 length:273 start_codon:yes stop_codon:yes gene_type:complete